jgi:PAS domain S-box-containing protein
MNAVNADDQLYRAIVEECPDAILFADRQGIIRLWNKGAERLFGYTADEALGQSLDLIIPEKLRGRHWEGYYRVMASGETKYQTGLLSSPGRRKDGTQVSLEFSMGILHDKGGNVSGCSAVLRDVTERWNREKALKERLKELEAS